MAKKVVVLTAVTSLLLLAISLGWSSVLLRSWHEFRGVVVSVNYSDHSITLAQRGGEQRVVAWDKGTLFRYNGNVIQPSQLVIGGFAYVRAIKTHAGWTARQIWQGNTVRGEMIIPHENVAPGEEPNPDRSWVY